MSPEPLHALAEDAATTKDYQYQPLDADAHEIRLIRLLPGKFDDQIVIEILHTPLTEPEPVEDTRPSIDHIDDTLPQSWSVSRTIYGRYIYYNNYNDKTTWKHPTEDIFGEVEVPDLHSDVQLKYQALSYVWGNEDATCKVMVDPNQLGAPPTHLHIRPSLYQALRYLRDIRSERLFWADAICINQADLTERNREVQRMALIYSLSSKTIIWLGAEEEDGSSDRALNVLGYLGEQFVFLPNLGISLPTPGFHTGKIADTAFPSAYVHPSVMGTGLWSSEGNTPFYDGKDLCAIQKLLSRPWWDRIWVWQEASLSNSSAVLQCGGTSMPWFSVVAAIQYIITRGQLIFGETPDNALLRRCWYLSSLVRSKGSANSPFFTLLWKTYHAQYSEKHDRIYALLGLAPPDLVNEIKVDYSRDAHEVFYDVCLFLIKHDDSLEFLAFCNAPGELHNLSNPSWVPNWNDDKLQLLPLDMYPAGLHAHNESHTTVQGTQLIVSAIVYGRVRSVTDACSNVTNLTTSVLQHLDDLRERIHGKKTHGLSVQDLVLTLLCGEVREFWPDCIDLPAIEDALKTFSTNVTSPDLYQYALGRSFFWTPDGKLGLGPCQTLPGDYLAIIRGFSLVMVLRRFPHRSTGQTQTYKVVGPAYMQDYVHAQALHGPVPPNYQVYYDYVDYPCLTRRFRNTETGEDDLGDPRLGDIPPGWVQKEEGSQWYINTETGKCCLEPRDQPEELRKKGVDFKRIVLV